MIKAIERKRDIEEDKAENDEEIHIE